MRASKFVPRFSEQSATPAFDKYHFTFPILSGLHEEHTLVFYVYVDLMEEGEESNILALGDFRNGSFQDCMFYVSLNQQSLQAVIFDCGLKLWMSGLIPDCSVRRILDSLRKTQRRPPAGIIRGNSTKNTPTRNQTGLFASPRSLRN